MMRNGRERFCPVAPPASITGSTGTTQGEAPEIRPPIKATKYKSPMGDLFRSLRPHSLSFG
jgi:hypothetical protein